jgi:hypothetical protein
MFTVAVKRTRHVDLSKVNANLRGPKKVKVGLVSGEADEDEIMKGIYNHFGTATIPERPFLTAAMRDNRDKYRRGMKASAKALLLNQTALFSELTKLGKLAQRDVQESITTWTTPPNAPSTIEQKGSAQPLIDSGEMRKSVTWKVGDF